MGVISFQTNVNSLVAEQNLNINNSFQSKTIQQLTSGYRINSAGDDAAGLAVANQFRNETAELTQGVANGNNGVAQLQIMDGGMSNISQILDRLKTLAMQSASASFTGDRTTLNSEFQTDVAEIGRQAQSIGLNTGGAFAKNLAVFIGAGSGSQNVANSVVNVNLSTATVDAQSLGLSGVQAVNSATYDLSGSSDTSVHAILNDGINAGSNSSPAANTQFTFYGAGFSNSDGSTGNSGVTITVNLNGVGDTDSLVNAINSAIQAQAQMPTGQASAFAKADIKASIVTDANGSEKLAFTSDNSAFQVAADDRTSNALMGNFDAGGNAATGAISGTQINARAAATIGSMDFSSNNVVLHISGDGMSSPATVTLNTDLSGGTLAAAETAIQGLVRTATGDSGFSVSDNAGVLAFTGSKGGLSVYATGNAAQVGTLGMDYTTTAGGTAVQSGKAVNATYVSGGAYEMASTTGGSAAVSNLQWNGAVGAGGQTVSLAANDASGVSHTLSVNLTASQNSIDKAVGLINDTLQKSGDSTLQQITAVAVTDSGVQKINFISTLPSFSVSVGKEATGAGVEDGAGNQGTTTQAQQIGTGGTADISTMAGRAGGGRGH